MEQAGLFEVNTEKRQKEDEEMEVLLWEAQQLFEKGEWEPEMQTEELQQWLKEVQKPVEKEEIKEEFVKFINPKNSGYAYEKIKGRGSVIDYINKNILSRQNITKEQRKEAYRI